MDITKITRDCYGKGISYLLNANEECGLYPIAASSSVPPTRVPPPKWMLYMLHNQDYGFGRVCVHLCLVCVFGG